MTGEEKATPEELSAIRREAGKETQFVHGSRANPQSQDAGGNKPWDIRNSLRDLAHRRADEGKDFYALTENEIIKEILPKKDPTWIQIGAARQIARWALGTGDAQYLTEQISGKVAQTTLNADIAALMGMSEEQIHEIIDKFNSSRDHSTPGGSSGDDSAAASGSETPA